MQHIEARAEEVLASVPAYVWNGRSLPVPVADIADTCFGLLVVEQEDLTAAPGAPPLAPGQTLSGLLLADQREIWVSAPEAREWPPRRRFTIGHELGHWCLHRDDAQHSIFCRAATVAEARAGVPLREDEANVFAAALLMPAPLLRKLYDRTGGDFDALCRIFGASQSAMGRRLHQVI